MDEVVLPGGFAEYRLSLFVANLTIATLMLLQLCPSAPILYIVN